ncbi:MAG: AI-2E family transporter [Pseudomonadota bacterium]|nr:AI-2E family transporter [Sphingomonas sp.]MDQ3478228.1 AI-2E family transporter [Pseudomonadota bacterium]
MAQERQRGGGDHLFLKLFAVPIGLAAAWFLYTVASGLLLLFLAIFIAIGLDGPVSRLERRGLSRHSAALIVLGIFFAVIIGVFWLVLPRVAQQLVALVNGFPDLVTQASQRLSHSLREYPDLQKAVQLDANAMGSLAPDAFKFLVGVGGASFKILGIIAALIIFFASIIYLTLNPRPLLVRYFSLYSDRLRPCAMRSFVRFSAMVGGWMRANLIVGTIQAILAGTFLTVMGIPGALVWATLAFFSDFVPRLGGYIMAAPPVLIALSVSPGTALTVALFYAVTQEVLGALVTPQVSGAQMNIHPFLIIVSLVVLALAFGLMGALVATPVAAFVVSHMDGFRSREPERDAERLVDEERQRAVRKRK